MDSSAPQTVLKGVAITSSLCGLAAGLYGGFKHSMPTKYLLYSAVNSGIVAATFFSIREYIVSPVLILTLPGKQYQLRRRNLLYAAGNSVSEEPAVLSWADLRTSRLLDSGISGGFAGSILNTWKRGRRGLVPGLTTGALLCALLQLGLNEFNILRIRYISSTPTASAQLTTHTVADAGQGSPEEFPMAVPIQPSPAAYSLMDCVLPIFGQRISDEKFLERLKMERDSHLRRIAELQERKQ